LIQHLRDEAHRFGISFHRKKRSQHFTESELESIPGIGKKTTQELLKVYKSVDRIKQLNKEDLEDVIGQAKAKLIFDYFNKLPGE
jgi:excinuclease ABC subunit C